MQKVLLSGIIVGIFLTFYFIQNEASADQASGKPAWQYGSATSSIVCGDKLCSEIEQSSDPEFIGVEPPLKQVAQGIEREAVVCNEGLVLIIKHNGSPACVKHETAVKLEERGWGGMPPPCCKDTDGIHSFEECAAAGNPVMESYPRQCRTPDGKHFVEIIPGKEQCEIAGGLWGIWGNQLSATASCNPATSDVGKECTDSSQCQSFCQANEGAEINSEEAGTCYGYELAICMQEVRNGVVDFEWCQ